jgi:hypothetical protein
MGELARRITATSSPEYMRAFLKLARDPSTGSNSWNGAERAAWEQQLEIRAGVNVGTAAEGSCLVPSELDPSILLTNASTQNAIRAAARVVTLATSSVWHGDLERRVERQLRRREH